LDLSIKRMSLYQEYSLFKHELMKHLIHEIFNQNKILFDSGDMIFTGSLVYSKIGIIKSTNFNDIDISISNNISKDTVIENMKYFDLKYYNDIFNSKFLKTFDMHNMSNIVAIDIFNNEHPIHCNTTIQLFPNIYTKYFGHEWNIDKIYDTYLKILQISNESKQIKQKYKYKNLFREYLKRIDVNDFVNKELVNNIIKILSEL